MSTEDAATTAKPDEQKTGGADDFKPITTPEEMSRFLSERDLVINQRVARERDKYADYADLKKAKAEYDKTLQAAMTDQEKAVAAARKEGETSVLERTNDRLKQAEARALAAGVKFRDPTDAVRFLDLKVVNVGDDGEVDSKAIADQLKTLAKEKPYLVDDGKGVRPRPDNSQGNSSEDGRPKGGSVAQVMADRAAARAARNPT